MLDYLFSNSVLWNIGVAIFLLLVTVTVVSRYRAKQRRASWSSGNKDVVVLHCPARGRFAPSMSPYVLKLESYLRLADIPYKVDFDEPIGPKGKTPWVTINDEDLTDSQLVMETLAKRFDRDMNSNLTEEQKAIARTFALMMDEHLIWGIRVWRYDVDKCAGFSECMAEVPLLLKVGMPIYRWRMVNALWHQGIGRHSFGEVVEIVRKDLGALSNFLGHKPYVMGDEACEVDCTVFAHLANIFYNYQRSPFYAMIKEFNNLDDYLKRMKERIWPDWHKHLST